MGHQNEWGTLCCEFWHLRVFQVFHQIRIPFSIWGWISEEEKP
jgi:hypothetical protein